MYFKMYVYLKVVVIATLISNATTKIGDSIIDNDICDIPNIPPFDSTFKPLENYEYISCNTTELLSYVTVEENIATLHIKEDLIQKLKASCCYSYIRRTTTPNWPDRGIPRLSRCRNISSATILRKNTVKVICFNDTDPHRETIYENIHEIITPAKYVDLGLNRSTNNKAISVLLIVIDSVSRLNFVRTMPKTRNYILENEFIEFTAYNKVNDNTLPNFMAWLTGMNQTEIYKVCKPSVVGGLDRCPSLWKDYSNLGYVTAYAEDWSSLNTFNYNTMKGFAHQPTTFYFKPYFEATETLQLRYQDTMPFCSGPESEGERVLNLARTFSKTFRNQPSFGVFWMNTFSHNNINATARMDDKFKNFFFDLKKNGILEDSVVFFLSDHGIRFGEIIGTPRGFFEERLPMNYISLPKWFKEKYSEKANTLKRNSLMLTSTFDLFMTLQDILVLSGFNYSIKPSSACPMCMSFFDNIQENRNCIEAGIPEKWCTCVGYWEEVEEPQTLLDSFWSVFLEHVKGFGNVYQILPVPAIKKFKAYKSKRMKNVFIGENQQSYYLVFIEFVDLVFYQVILNENKVIIYAQQRYI